MTLFTRMDDMGTMGFVGAWEPGTSPVDKDGKLTAHIMAMPFQNTLQVMSLQLQHEIDQTSIVKFTGQPGKNEGTKKQVWLGSLSGGPANQAQPYMKNFELRKT